MFIGEFATVFVAKLLANELRLQPNCRAVKLKTARDKVSTPMY